MLQKSQASLQIMQKAEALELVKAYKFLQDPHQHVQDYMKTLFDSQFNKEQLVMTPATVMIDLHLLLTQPTGKKFNSIRGEYMPLIKDKLKDMNDSTLKLYLKRIMQKDDLTNSHIRILVDFMINQKNIGDLPTSHIYKLANKIIVDSMVGSQTHTEGSNR